MYTRKLWIKVEDFLWNNSRRFCCCIHTTLFSTPYFIELRGLIAVQSYVQQIADFHEFEWILEFTLQKANSKTGKSEPQKIIFPSQMSKTKEEALLIPSLVFVALYRNSIKKET